MQIPKSKEAILENMNRRLIIKEVKNHSGITFTEIKNDLGLKNGVLAYHLSLLEKNHYIKSFSDGKFKRFYSKGVVITGLTSVEEIILNIIKTNPDISRIKIAEMMEYSQGTVNSHINKLYKKDLVGMKKIGKYYAYHSTNPNTINNKLN
jgi:predicted transcriptional regulator